jgi:hypothetical protein
MLVHPQELMRKILEIIQTQSTIQQRPPLLANVGWALAKYYRRPFKELSVERTLADFIRRHLSEQVQLLQNPMDPLVLMAALKNQPRDSSAATISPDGLVDATGVANAEFSTERRPATTSSQRFPRYDSSFWAAFSKPLREGFRRFIKIDRPFYFVDNTGSSPAPIGFMEIEAGFVAPQTFPPIPGRHAMVIQQIEAWLQKNNLRPDPFQYQPRRVQERMLFETALPRAALTDEQKPGAGPHVVQLFSMLDQKDLERIAMPADVWLKLMRL